MAAGPYRQKMVKKLHFRSNLFLLEIDAQRGFITFGGILGSLVPFRTHLVGLFTFYLDEKYHYFLMVLAFYRNST